MNQLPKPKIMIVDDTPANIIAMKSALESLDLEVIEANSGNEALSKLLRHHFAAVLLDVEMPGMNGIETAELMMQIEETRFVPIIFITAKDKNIDFIFRGYEVGAVDYIFKPIQPAVLKSKISAFVKLYQQNKSLSALVSEKDKLLHLVEDQNKKKDALLKQLNEQQEKINHHTKFKMWITGIGAAVILIGVFAYFSHLISYTKELNELNAYTNQLNNAYKRFIPYDILNLLSKNDITEVKLGDQVLKEMMVLFVDVRGYSTLSENLTPEENMKLINEILQILQEPIMKRGGIINKYLGDGLMALFDKNTDNALVASVDVLQNLNAYNQKRIGKGLPPIRVGIGIDGGKMMLGTVGSSDRMEHTVVSDAVNVASRIEGMTKIYGASLLISEYVYDQLTDPKKYHIRLMDIVRVQGREKPVIVYQVLDGECKATIDLHYLTLEDFSEGILLFHEKKCAEALHSFNKVLEVNPDDIAAKTYRDRCESYLKNPLKQDWTHIRDLAIK